MNEEEINRRYKSISRANKPDFSPLHIQLMSLCDPLPICGQYRIELFRKQLEELERLALILKTYDTKLNYIKYHAQYRAFVFYYNYVVNISRHEPPQKWLSLEEFIADYNRR